MGPGSILTAEPLWGFGVLGLLEVGVLSRGWGWGARQLLYFNAKREFSRGGGGAPPRGEYASMSTVATCNTFTQKLSTSAP